MSRFGRIAAAVGRLRHPNLTVRGRLTLLYGCSFLVSGAVLLAITYGGTSARAVVVARASGTAINVGPGGVTGPGGVAGLPGGLPVPLIDPGVAGSRAAVLVSNQRVSDLHQLLVVSVVALAVMALISVVLGRLVAGRVLRPLRVMTAATREISELNLHERLALPGPRDELKELADTIDGLLGRLEDAFDAQRRFVANASHELRTPLTVARALLEMTLGDPDATVESFRTTSRQALEAGEEQEQLIDALLMLARSQRGLDRRERVDLALVARDGLRDHEAAARAAGLTVDAALAPAVLAGDPRLVGRLVSNVIGNAVRHNVPDGGVDVAVEDRAGQAVLRVANTGPPVAADQIERLLQPFERASGDRVGDRAGLGLGLSIVAAIAAAHGATLDVRPRDGGGLVVEVRFPRP